VITGIYAYHILHGLASFEVEPPSEKELRQRYFDIIGGGFPYLVAERAGEIVGTPMRHPTARGRLIATPRKTLFTRTRLGPVGVSVDS
jgi:L-amino acid N-acyltransferase YncA